MAIVTCPYCTAQFASLDELAEHIRLVHPDTGRISGRVGGTIENWSTRWGERLKAFISGIISWGLELLLDLLGRAFAPKLQPMVDMLEATGKVPPELQKILDEIKEPTGQIGALLAQSAGGALIGGAVGRVIDAIILPLAYAINSQTRNVEISETQMIALWLRRVWSAEQLDEKLSWLGVPTDNVENLKGLTEIRLDPTVAMLAWRRNPEQFVAFLQDLKDQGWNDPRIEALKEATKAFPSVQDVTTWLAREVFEPAMVEKYGLLDELPAYEETLYPRIGIDQEQATNYWIAHWVHPSWMQIVEMLHRDLITEADVQEWFRLVEIPPFWRQLLIDQAYTWPTRVDVRRWWDMRTIDETELRRLYSGMGYRGVNLDNYVLWTKVYVAFPDLMARWTKGWITEADVRAELIALGMPSARVETMIQTKIKPTEQEPISEAKKVSQTAIIKWVKEDIEARWEQGIDLLMDLGYDENGARFVLDAYIAEAGSPETYEDWKKVTGEYKIATGKEAKPMPEELKKAAEEVVRLTGEVAALEEAVTEEEKGLIDDEVLPEEATERLKELQVARNRAIAELDRVKSDYDRLVAEWRQQIP